MARISTAKELKKILFALTVCVGVILFWRGVWETSSAYFSPAESAAFGLGILLATGMLIREFI